MGKVEDLAKAIRRNVLDMALASGVNGGHIGGAFSCADILALLYGEVMNVFPDNPQSPTRDRFLLSKGHVALAHYAVLAECGFISREEMMTFQTSGSDFPTHEVLNLEKGVEISSGSLGYGLSIGVGCALAAKRKEEKHRVYVLMGDGECNEGSVWEAAMSAAKYKLDNLTAIVDVNDQQLDGYSKDVMPIHNIADVFRGFGFHVEEVDGNNIEQLRKAFNSSVQAKPTAIVAHTVKGKGVKAIEGKLGWHHASLSQEQYDAFICGLEE